jgi:hypothetical protein
MRSLLRFTELRFQAGVGPSRSGLSAVPEVVREQLIINELLVEAAGVELFRVLITRNLLILGIATTAKKTPLPDPLYVYCTKILFALESNRHHIAATVSHRSSGMDQRTPSFLRYRNSPPFHFFGTSVFEDFQVARHSTATGGCGTLSGWLAVRSQLDRP